MTYNCFRILPYNYADIDILANYSVTSENSLSYPVTNIFNKQRRGRVWQSQGYFNIDSTNKDIIFKETSGGSTLTASIIEGEYTSITTFAAAIKAALDLSGVSTYTVTHVNNRFRITSSGSYFELLPTNILFTAADIIGFSTDRTTGTTHTADIERIHQYEQITLDLGVATKPQCFCMTDTRNGTLKITPGASVTLIGNHTNNWTSPGFSQTISVDTNVMSIFSDTTLGTDGYRYWALRITDRENPNGKIQLGSFYLGDYFDPIRGRPQFPLSTRLIDRSVTTFSEGGETYSDEREKTAEYSILWYGLQKADIDEFEQRIWREYGTSRPFWVSMDTNAAFTGNRNNRIIFCKFAQEPSWRLVRPDIFELDVSLREEL